jgi:hypothetical protein
MSSYLLSHDCRTAAIFSFSKRKMIAGQHSPEDPSCNFVIGYQESTMQYLYFFMPLARDRECGRLRAALVFPRGDDENAHPAHRVAQDTLSLGSRTVLDKAVCSGSAAFEARVSRRTSLRSRRRRLRPRHHHNPLWSRARVIPSSVS